MVAKLSESLNAPDIRLKAAAGLRELIEKVVLTPNAEAPDGLRAERHGDLAVLLALVMADAPPRRSGRRGGSTTAGTSVPGGLLSVVAGTGFEPVTFRL